MVDYRPNPSSLRCTGDEDLSTAALRRCALSRALTTQSDVQVDLSDLRFADTSLVLDLMMVARRLRQQGCAMVLRDPQPQIWRLIELTGLNRLPSVQITQGAAA
ncbi:MAG TPA: STAS domain-containing protein [Solirubrobacteraceae bacterium]|nr:STAS domain-containing protein [Solirubrobacteraceae bacterium]